MARTRGEDARKSSRKLKTPLPDRTRAAHILVQIQRRMLTRKLKEKHA